MRQTKTEFVNRRYVRWPSLILFNSKPQALAPVYTVSAQRSTYAIAVAIGFQPISSLEQ